MIKNYREIKFIYKLEGFSLIELLVVIGILAIVISVVVPNFMGARERARDVQRKNDLIQMQKALELYKLDQVTPVYPSPSAFPLSLCNSCWSSGANCTGNVYMRKLPCDPAGLAPTPYYYDRTTGLNYNIVACLENPADSDRDPTPNPVCTITNSSYTINEP